MDDLTVLEKVNLLIAGLSSFYSKSSVPNDVADPEIAKNSHDISYRENQPLSYRLEN